MSDHITSQNAMKKIQKTLKKVAHHLQILVINLLATAQVSKYANPTINDEPANTTINVLVNNPTNEEQGVPILSLMQELKSIMDRMDAFLERNANSTVGE